MELWIGERLGEDVGQLEACVDLDRAHFLVLDHFMREVLADVDVCFARSLPPMMRLPHSMLAVLSSNTGVSGSCVNPYPRAGLDAASSS